METFVTDDLYAVRNINMCKSTTLEATIPTHLDDGDRRGYIHFLETYTLAEGAHECAYSFGQVDVLEGYTAIEGTCSDTVNGLGYGDFCQLRAAEFSDHTTSSSLFSEKTRCPILVTWLGITALGIVLISA